MNLAMPGSLVAIALGLGGLIAYQALAPIPAIEVPPPPPSARVDVTASALSQPAVLYVPPPKEDFAAINERFAFSPTRQAVAEPSQATGVDVAPPEVTLVGVIISPQKSVAILKPGGAALAISAVIGQMVDGWQLVRIEAGRVVLHANTTDYEIRLRSGQASGSPPGAQPGTGNKAPASAAGGNL
ncbi:MAG TPA: hypothetical protein VN932_00010 [Rhizomicrobium sp.]|nr:hypothetical protein [Rhizomicrobium sp.]